MTRELLEQALEALDNSVDLVYQEYTEATLRYANIPTRKAKLNGLAAFAKAHDAARYAILAELEKPVQQERNPSPAWHDVPTGPGLWLCNEDERDPRDWVCWRVEYPEELTGIEDNRWYGPIPEDKQ